MYMPISGQVDLKYHPKWVAHHSASHGGKSNVVFLLILYNFPVVFISFLDL